MRFATLALCLCLGYVRTEDEAVLSEPSDAEYWGDGNTEKAPFPIPRFTMEEMTREKFDDLVKAGKSFVVKGVGDNHPMAKWDCQTFKTDPTFSGAEMNKMYAKDGGSGFVGFKDGWEKAASPSGAADATAPQKAPFYWGIKDVQYNDGNQSPTWRKSMLDKVRRHTTVPPFMDPRNKATLFRTPEFWFAENGAGAKAHVDTHVETTMSLQLASRKRWRIGYIPDRRLQHLSMLYHDGSVYEHGKWVPTHDLVLEKGEALFIPPAFIHETHNIGEGCAASVTYQFPVPMATGLYRTFLKRVRRTPDIWESWPIIKEWNTLGEDAGEDPREIFDQHDRNRDGKLDMSEIRGLRLENQRTRDNEDVLAYHDTNRDGVISFEEFQVQNVRWNAMEKDALASTPELGFGMSKMQLHYEELENLNEQYGRKFKKLQLDTMAQENRMRAAATKSEL